MKSTYLYALTRLSCVSCKYRKEEKMNTPALTTVYF